MNSCNWTRTGLVIFIAALGSSGYVVSYAESSAIICTVDGLDFSKLALPGMQDDIPEENYIASALADLGLGVDCDIVPFYWNRDPGASAELIAGSSYNDSRNGNRNLREFLRYHHDDANASGKWFIVVAHSWGTFLTYCALALESESDPYFECDLFVTLSCPLGVTDFPYPLSLYDVVVGGYCAGQLTHVRNRTGGPYGSPRAYTWINYWSLGDFISGPMRSFGADQDQCFIDAEGILQGRGVRSTVYWHDYLSLRTITSWNPLGFRDGRSRDSVRLLINSACGISVPSGPTPPTIVLTRPVTSTVSDEVFPIWWEDDDPDSNAEISLYRDNDSSGYNGHLIAGGIQEDWHEGGTGADGIYYMFTADLPEGDMFYVYAVIDDKRNSPVYSNYSAKISIDHPERGDAIEYGSVWTDLNPPHGDRDGVAEAGETVVCQLHLRNRSSSPISRVDAWLTSTDPRAKIQSDYYSHGNLAPGESTPAGEEAFRVQLDFHETRSVDFRVHIKWRTEDDSQYWDDQWIEVTFPEDGTVFPVFEVCRTEINPDYDPGRADLDFILESGESVGFDLYLRNVGAANAEQVDVKLTNVRGNGRKIYGDFEINCGAWYGYPDVDAGSPCLKQLFGNLSRVKVPKDFAGMITADITVRYGVGQIELPPLEDVVLFIVEPDPWLWIYPPRFGFGVVNSATSVWTEFTATNAGTAQLTITGFSASHGDTTADLPGLALPLVLSPGAAARIRVHIDASTVLCNSIERTIQVLSTGRVDDVEDRFTITGMVCDAVPVYSIDSAGHEPDVSGSIIAYADMTSGYPNIVTYDFANATKTQVTASDAHKSRPRVSGNLIAWQQRKSLGPPPEFEIFAFDMEAPERGPLPVDPVLWSPQVVGLDGKLLAISDVYEVLYNSDSQIGGYARNLVVYEYQGMGVWAQVFSTGWVPGVGNTSRLSVASTLGHGDFRAGMLAFRQFEYMWREGASGGYWVGVDQHVAKTDYARGEVTPSRVLDGRVDRLAAGAKRLAFVQEFTNAQNQGGYQVWLWEDGHTRRLTEPSELAFDHGDVGIAIGTDFAVYNKRLFEGLPALMYWDFRAPQAGYPERPLKRYSSEDFEWVADDSVRMNEHTVVWTGGLSGVTRVFYAFLGVDIAVHGAGIIPVPEFPWENECIDVSVTVRNTSPDPTTDTVNVSLYDGDPDAGGVLLGQEEIVGGIPANDERSTVFECIVLAGGSHQLYAKCTVLPFENPANNKAFREIEVIPVPPTEAPTNTPTPAPVPDTDGDGIPDSLESGTPGPSESNMYLADSDGDGLGDGVEDGNRNGQLDAGETSCRDRDSDDDSVEDGIEVLVYGSDPLNPNDPISFLRTDQDSDGLPAAAPDPNDSDPDVDDDRFMDGYEAVSLGLEAVSDANAKPALGDLNLDGWISNMDALAAQSLFMGKVSVEHSVFKGEGFKNGDPSRDGFVSNADALLLQAVFLGRAWAYLPHEIDSSLWYPRQ